MNEDTINSAMLSPKASELLSIKNPKCPKCGEKGGLNIRGTASHDFLCNSEEHEFVKDTEEILTEEEVRQLLLNRLTDSTVTTNEIRRILANNFNATVKQQVDPNDGITVKLDDKYVSIKYWLEVHELKNLENFVQIRTNLEQNPYIQCTKKRDKLKILVLPSPKKDEKLRGDDKAEFTRKASNNNGSIQVNIPPEIVSHLKLHKGDTIGLQTEHSEEYGEYASFWNQTKQGGDEK